MSLAYLLENYKTVKNMGLFFFRTFNDVNQITFRNAYLFQNQNLKPQNTVINNPYRK